jgi:hypothetical protein
MFATENRAIKDCFPIGAISPRKAKHQANTSELAITASSTGRILRMRRAQKLRNEKIPDSSSFITMDAIRKPEITKKTSTPTKPPGIQSSPIWNRMTGITAHARRPSISGRYLIELMLICLLSEV